MAYRGVARALGAMLVLAACGGAGAWAGEEAAAKPPAEEAGTACAGLCERPTLTDSWFGLGKRPPLQWLDLKLSATQIYQGVARGGVSTHRRRGRYVGSYDLELEADLDQAAGLKGASLYVLTEGGWSPGIEGRSLATSFGVNGDAMGNHAARVTEFRYDQSLFDGKLRLRMGKIDLTGGFECHGCPVAFDGNRYANDETTQFINGALVNNPTIPFPQNGLGLVLYFQPTDAWYVAAGVADAQAQAGEMGSNTAFEGRDYSISLYETGYVMELPSANGPLHGAYRLGLWYDPQPKDRFNGSRPMRDDVGLYASMDQGLLRETKDPQDVQGLGAFARFGFANAAVNPIKFFWSTGLEYRGLLPGRDADALGLGVAQGRTARSTGAGFTDRYETAFETYYSVEVAPWLHVSPHVQYLANPGGMKEARDAVVLGVRVQAAF